jgi:hypothetical protein
VAHLNGRVEAGALPRETAGHGPIQDAGGFLVERVGQEGILLAAGDGDDERHQFDASPDRVIGAAQRADDGWC